MLEGLGPTCVLCACRGSVPCTFSIRGRCETRHSERTHTLSGLKDVEAEHTIECREGWITSAGVVDYLCGTHCKVSLTWLEHKLQRLDFFFYTALHRDSPTDLLHRGRSNAAAPLRTAAPAAFAYNLAASVASRVTPLSFHRHTPEYRRTPSSMGSSVWAVNTSVTYQSTL